MPHLRLALPARRQGLTEATHEESTLPVTCLAFITLANLPGIVLAGTLTLPAHKWLRGRQRERAAEAGGL
ncbi:hypothetical protein ACWGLF_12020 [Streptomyces puniciscabiei]